MPSKTLRILLLIAALAGTIQSYGQLDTGKLCLTYHEFDFYANALVERNGLAVDTAYLNSLVREGKKHVKQLEGQVKDTKDQVLIKESIANTYKNSFETLSKKHEKQGRKLTFFKRTNLVFIVSTILLGAVVFLKPG